MKTFQRCRGGIDEVGRSWMFELHVWVEEHKEATRHGNEDSDAKQNGLNRFISYKVIIKNEKPILFNHLE